jgi:integral membrane protein
VPDFADSTTTELERKLAPLRVVALTETVTYVVLFFFWVTGNRPGRLLMGSVHGMVFLAFAAMVLGVRADMRWTWKYAAAAIILGPVGALMVYSRLRREGVPASS